MISKEDLIRYGVAGLLQSIANACYKAQQHYGGTPSKFLAWAIVIEAHLTEMKKDADELYEILTKT